MERLTGKRAIVTGAASGIGRASALLFARQGATVLATDLDGDGLSETVAEIERARGQALAIPSDSSDPEAVSALVQRCLADHGGLEVFYANAGVSGGIQPVFDLEVDDWMSLLRVNLVGPFLAIKHAGPIMRERGGGSIICTSSVAGLRSGAGSTHYSASKAAVISLVQTAACQLAGTNVRVNAICPGLIETGMTEPLFQYARATGKEHKIGQLNPTRRAGRPEEVAQAALFLASDESSYVNGQAIAVDGGLSASHPVVPGRMV